MTTSNNPNAMPDKDPAEITGQDLETLAYEYGKQSPGLEQVKFKALQQIRKERETEVNPQFDGLERNGGDSPDLDQE